MIDLKSILGYQQGSPYSNNPYLDIHTPEGLIDMSNTPMDLVGIDNKGNKKKMKANSKNPYKFEGSIVREIPIMQRGGLKAIDFYKYIFNDEPQTPVSEKPVQEDQTPIESSSISTYEDNLQKSQNEFESVMSILSETDNYDEGIDYSINTGTSSNQGFASYATPEEGRQALERQLNLYKTGRTRVGLDGNSTLLQAMSKYAPVGDGNNNPYSYAQTIAKYTGVNVNTPISQIDTKKWADVITKVEGNKSGNNPGNLRR